MLKMRLIGLVAAATITTYASAISMARPAVTSFSGFNGAVVMEFSAGIKKIPSVGITDSVLDPTECGPGNGCQSATYTAVHDTVMALGCYPATSQLPPVDPSTFQGYFFGIEFFNDGVVDLPLGETITIRIKFCQAPTSALSTWGFKEPVVRNWVGVSAVNSGANSVSVTTIDPSGVIHKDPPLGNLIQQTLSTTADYCAYVDPASGACDAPNTAKLGTWTIVLKGEAKGNAAVVYLFGQVRPGQ
jgi:hypothetical protein